MLVGNVSIEAIGDAVTDGDTVFANAGVVVSVGERCVAGFGSAVSSGPLAADVQDAMTKIDTKSVANRFNLSGEILSGIREIPGRID